MAHVSAQLPGDYPGLSVIEKFDWLEYDIQPDNICNLTSPDGVQISLRPRGRYAKNDPLVLIDWLQAGRVASQSFCLSRFD